MDKDKENWVQEARERVTGSVTRISGPIIYANNMDWAALYDVVEVGEERLIGEIIRQNKGQTTIQVYEDDTGLRIGSKVYSTERPLSLRLGPGLMGMIYDGIQRPLKEISEKAGVYLSPGDRVEPLDPIKRWHFFAGTDKEGRKYTAGSEIEQGLVIGSVQETKSVLHKILIPPYIRGKKLSSFKGSGDYTVDDTIGVTELGEEIKLSQYWPVRTPRPFDKKLQVTEPLLTGQRVIDVFFPLSKGGTAAIPGGFGTGKTMTQHAIAKWCDADIIVYIGCGERGNEMTEVLTEFPSLIDPRTNRSIMERTILIANTSNMPVAAREVSLYSGVTLAEYFRDMGLCVAIMADSTSRWAEALRELSGRMEEMPAEEGFPAYLPSRLASFYERAGRVKTLGNKQEGSVSIIGAVSPPGGDFSEPVTQHTKRFIRCFWALDRDLANSRHYPAIGWLSSYSEYAEEVEDWWKEHEPRWKLLRERALALLKEENELQKIVRLVGTTSLSESKKLVLKVSDMIKNGFLQQNAFDDIDMYCTAKKQIALLSLIMHYYDLSLEALKEGVSLEAIDSLTFPSVIIRLKMQVPNEDIKKIEEVDFDMQKAFSTMIAAA